MNRKYNSTQSNDPYNCLRAKYGSSFSREAFRGLGAPEDWVIANERPETYDPDHDDYWKDTRPY